MPPQELAIVTPRAEEVTRVATIAAGAGITGVVEGVMVKLAPEMGVLQPLLTLSTTFGVPMVGAAGALFTRGLISDLFMGIAAGGLGVFGYTLPEVFAPLIGKGPGGNSGVKLLSTGAQAAQRAQARAAVATKSTGLEF